MPDASIATGDTGAYELPIAAGATITVDVASRGLTLGIAVLVHSGTSPVYVKNGATVAAKDQTATMIPVSSWSSIPAGPSSTIAITSAAAAVVSVYRP